MSLARKSTYNSGYDPYKSNEISTMSQGKLVVMLYEGAIRFANTAIENMTPRKYEIVNRNNFSSARKNSHLCGGQINLHFSSGLSFT